MNNSLINEIDPVLYVYRIFSVERLFQLFDTKKNVLVHPSKWDDPFENCILSGLVELESGNKAQFGFKDHVFGQCWTSCRESDAMWRIYSPDKNGVRVRAKVRTLIEGLRSTDLTFADISCFIGKVKYLQQKQFGSLNINVLDNTGKGIADSLLYKRMEFNHEKEVRLIYSMNNPPRNVPRIFSYSFDPAFAFDEITFDPRLNERMFNVYANALTNDYSYPRKAINQSQLYTPPSAFITKLNA